MALPYLMKATFSTDPKQNLESVINFYTTEISSASECCKLIEPPSGELTLIKVEFCGDKFYFNPPPLEIGEPLKYSANCFMIDSKSNEKIRCYVFASEYKNIINEIEKNVGNQLISIGMVKGTYIGDLKK